jgi:hypothetical protein
METFTERLKNLNKAAMNIIQILIHSKGVESKHMNEMCLEIKNDELSFNLDGPGYLDELHYNKIVDTEGHHYFYSVLTTDQICELVDYFMGNREDYDVMGSFDENGDLI